MAAQLHFVSGKGGTGKSTFAASLAHALATDPKNLPLLLIDLQGSGSSAHLLGVQDIQYRPRPSISVRDVWAARIYPQESFQEYFARALYPGSDDSTLGQATAGLRSRLVKGIFSNSVVRSFVEVCPGLEPSAMLGKIHFECTEGAPPESSENWKHVIVDSPSSGHFLALFSSIEALTRVFSSGIVLRQASEIFQFISDPEKTRVYLLTLPSDLPIQEALELRRNLAERKISVHAIIANRMRIDFTDFKVPNEMDVEWKKFISIEEEIFAEERRLVDELKRDNLDSSKILELPECFTNDPTQCPQLLSKYLVDIL